MYLQPIRPTKLIKRLQTLTSWLSSWTTHTLPSRNQLRPSKSDFWHAAPVRSVTGPWNVWPTFQRLNIGYANKKLVKGHFTPSLIRNIKKWTSLKIYKLNSVITCYYIRITLSKKNDGAWQTGTVEIVLFGPFQPSRSRHWAVDQRSGPYSLCPPGDMDHAVEVWVAIWPNMAIWNYNELYGIIVLWED